VTAAARTWLRAAIAILLAARLGQAVPVCQSPPVPVDWAARLRAGDPKIRAAAEAALVRRAPASLGVLRRFLAPEHEDLHQVTFEILRRIGPSAIPLLTDLLHDKSDAIRRETVDVLIDLAPHTASMQAALRRALRDDDPVVAGDAARALGALGRRASPSVSALVRTLAHDDGYVRIYAAEALASIGPTAAAATPALIEALTDPIPGVRWAAAEALGRIGPAARSAAPQLTNALDDEFLYVRIFASDALSRITGVTTDESVASRGLHVSIVPPALAAPPVEAGNPPVDWDAATGRNVTWSVELGHATYGRPVVAGGTVYVGTDNALHLDPDYPQDAGVLMAFRVTDGTFLWQDVTPRVERGLREFLLPSTTSAPYVEGDRIYYVTSECQLRALDAQGSRVWELDICGRLGVFPHEATNSEVLPLGDLLLVSTSNGQNEGHTLVPSPRAPSLIAVDKRSGEVVWSAIGAGGHVLHGQWSSPVAASINGQIQVLFGGGDGWLRAYDAATGREIWRFDGNPADARWLPRPGVLSRSFILASPVFADGRVFIAMGQSPGHGNGPSFVHAIAAGGHGNVTGSGLLWTSRDVGRVVATPLARDGLLYVADVGGIVYCLDAATGVALWKHDTLAPIWGCLLLAGDRLYVGNEEGTMTVLRADRRKQVLAQIDMPAALYSRPAVVGDVIYVATANRLYRIAANQ
jgi:outer membrane protein assembly factor BamB